MMPRPVASFHGFCGQSHIVASLREHCAGALAKSTPLPHILLAGPSGMGKTELAKCLAKEMGTDCHDFYSSPQSKRWQLAKHLSDLKRGDLVFLDETHALQDSVQELLFPAIDMHRVPVVDAEKHRIQENEWLEIPRFTLVVATDQSGKLKNALKQRLVLRYVLRSYAAPEMKLIVQNRAAEIGLLLSPQAARRIAEATRGVPRRARHILHSLHTCLPDPEVTVSKPMADRHLFSIGIDGDSLTRADRHYLSILARRGSTVSLHDLSTQVGLDEESVRQDVEPWLVERGLIAVEHRGRILTDHGRAYVRERGLS